MGDPVLWGVKGGGRNHQQTSSQKNQKTFQVGFQRLQVRFQKRQNIQVSQTPKNKGPRPGLQQWSRPLRFEPRQ